jgi:hypothetical protein
MRPLGRMSRALVMCVSVRWRRLPPLLQTRNILVHVVWPFTRWSCALPVGGGGHGFLPRRRGPPFGVPDRHLPPEEDYGISRPIGTGRPSSGRGASSFLKSCSTGARLWHVCRSGREAGQSPGGCVVVMICRGGGRFAVEEMTGPLGEVGWSSWRRDGDPQVEVGATYRRKRHEFPGNVGGTAFRKWMLLPWDVCRVVWDV